MAEQRTKWTQIQVENKKTDELSEVEINLEDEDNENGSVEVNDRNTSRNVQSDKEDKDSTVGSKERKSEKENAQERPQVETDDEDEQPQGQSRRARRIRTLSSRVAQLEQELLAERQGKAQVESNFARTRANEVVRQKKFFEDRIKEKETAYEKAVEANDAKAQATALRELNDAQIKHTVYEAAEQELPDEADDQVPAPQRQAQPQRPPPAAERWVAKNKWFLENQAAHMAARAVNAQLFQEGYDPTSEDYYEELDARLEDGGLNLKKLRGVKEEEQQEQKPQQRQQRRSPVGGSEGDSDVSMGGNRKTQFSREGNKVKVTPTDDDYETAEMLGRPIESYMKNKLIYEEHGGKGYTPIVVTTNRR